MRRIIRTGLVVLATLLILTIGAIAGFLVWFDPNDHRDTLVQAVEDATGRRLSIDGQMAFTPSLTPRLAVSNVRLANPDWAQVPEMVRIGRLEASVDLLALLGGRIAIDRIVLTAPEVNLEVAADGRPSWAFAQAEGATAEPETEAADSAAPPPVTFSTIRIERGRFRLINHTGRLEKIDINHLVVLMDDPSGPIHSFGSLSYNDEAVSLTGTLGNLATLFANRPLPIDFVATAAGSRLTVAGRIAKPMDAAGIDITVRTEGAALTDLGRLAVAATGRPAPIPAIGGYSLGLRLAGDPKSLRLEDLAGRFGHDGGVLLEVSGGVRSLTDAAGVDLQISGRVDSLEPLKILSPDPLPSLPPVSFAAQVSGSTDQIAIHDIDIAMGRSKLEGLVEVEPQARPLRVKAHLSSPYLDLVDVLPKPAEDGAEPSDPPAPAPSPDDAQTNPADAPSTDVSAAARRIFSDKPLPIDLLRQVSADIRVRADEIVAGDLRIGEAEIRAFLRRGVFHVTRAGGQVGGGELNASFTIDGRTGQKISLHTGLTAEGVQIGQVLRDTGADESVTGAPIDIRVSLSGAGASPQQLMASLAGDVLIQIGPGRLENPYVDLIGADLLNETISFLNPFDEADTGADLQCGVVATVLRRGQALIDQTVAIETGKTLLVMNGKLDLGTETLDLAVQTQSRSGFTVSAGSLAGLIRLGGTFAEPSVGFDTGGVARTAASLAAAVATGGVSLLAEAVVGAVTRDANPCRTALVRAKTALTSMN